MKVNSPLVSVIIPIFNSEEFILQTIKSLEKQSFQEWECLLIDDLSTDDFKKKLKNYLSPELKIKFYEKPLHIVKGANSCRNYGLTLARGKFIQWFDADDIMHPEMLEKKLEVLNSGKHDFVVSGGCIFKSNTSNIVGYWNDLYSEDPLLDHAFGKINFQTNSVLFRKDFLIQNNLKWNESLVRKQDYEFFSRVLGVSENYSVINKELFFYRLHEKSMSGKDSAETIPSLIKADQLVYKNLKKNRRVDFLVKRHFIRKNVGRFKRSLSDFKIYGIILALRNLLQIIDLDYLKTSYARRP